MAYWYGKIIQRQNLNRLDFEERVNALIEAMNTLNLAYPSCYILRDHQPWFNFLESEIP